VGLHQLGEFPPWTGLDSEEMAWFVGSLLSVASFFLLYVDSIHRSSQKAFLYLSQDLPGKGSSLSFQLFKRRFGHFSGIRPQSSPWYWIPGACGADAYVSLKS
jgi:hypothetical protein